MLPVVDDADVDGAVRLESRSMTCIVDGPAQHELGTTELVPAAGPGRRSTDSTPTDGAGTGVPGSTNTRTVFVVDPHEVSRLGLQYLLGQEGDLHLVGTGTTAEEAMRAVAEGWADIVLIDTDVEVDGGRHLARRLAGLASGARWCFLLGGNDPALASELSRLGASALLHKRASGQHLVEGLRRLASESLVLDPVTTGLLMAELLDPRAAPEREPLTERDHELLRLLGEGRTNREIAQAVFLSEKTVKNYLSRLFRKLGVRSRTEAALLSARLVGGLGPGGTAC